MSLEEEFATLCHRFFDLPQKDKTPDNLSTFFSRLIQLNQKVLITDEIRYFIPMLASYGSGLFSGMLDPCIEGLSPMHYVPDLSLATNLMINSTIKTPRTPKSSRSTRNPRSRRLSNNRCQTARTPRPKISDLNPVVQLSTVRSVPQTPKLGQLPFAKRTARVSFKPQLPPLTQTHDNVISTLYIRDNPTFFTGKVMRPKSLDIHIMPPKFPTYMIGNHFEMLSGTGVTKFTGNMAAVNPLPQFVLDQSNEFMVRQIFKNNNVGKCFFVWRELFREKRFRRIVANFDRADIVARPLFSQLIDKIREDIIKFTDPLSIFPNDFDEAVNDVQFDEFQTVSNKSIMEMEEITIKMAGDTENTLSEFFRQIRATNLQMQLDFEELHSLNLLPPALEEYSGDLKWRFPSLSRQRERNILLRKERKVAFLRQNYLGRFFSRARAVYNGTLVKQCQKCLLKYLNRFTPTYVEKRRMNKIYAIFDLDEGIVITPSHEEFHKWVESVVADIKHAYLLSNKLISSDIICEVDPEYECPHENPMLTIERFNDHKDMLKAAYAEIEDAFNYFQFKSLSLRNFMKELRKQVEYSRRFNNFHNFEELQSIIDSLLDSEKQLIAWPRNLFHKIPDNEEIIDFILEIRPSIENALKYVREAMADLQKRVIDDLNNRVFVEIQEKWASVKDSTITRADSKYIETRLVLYAIISDSLITAWKNLVGDLKGSFDALVSVYRSLNDKSPFTHVEALESFNNAAAKIGMAGVTFDENQEYEEEEEEVKEEEEEVKEMEKVKKPRRKERRKPKNQKQVISFNDIYVQTMTEEEEIAEMKKAELEDKTKKEAKEQIQDQIEEPKSPPIEAEPVLSEIEMQSSSAQTTI
ncbi:hypothetical protein TRFO_17441 [Tritrichomonas foetus]|uniref:Uncharacterized protein n=1 Tax=Tritrichomonas foetus TaxID=1144522 RepID=A0A1J4KN23_9EUKA|nr:hypothetical protein TRFO_17441 [Tritrichomonas foetus]|eukprot:OHT12713.1 hypothetical protein TRFO_17441 [Tritrichomonas foetus]